MGSTQHMRMSLQKQDMAAVPCRQKCVDQDSAHMIAGKSVTGLYKAEGLSSMTKQIRVTRAAMTLSL